MKAAYLHIPFCKTHCPYCDFAVWIDHKGLQFEKYTKAICCEIASRAEGEYLETIYLGGGTPSILPINNLEQILACLHKYFKIDPKAEITLELNPGTADQNKLKQIKALGINRLSVGVQTFEPELLRKLARGHTIKDALNILNWSKDIGFENISLDLIYGLPSQTLEDWQKTIETALKQGNQHISCYALAIEAGTPFAKIYQNNQNSNLPCEDVLGQMYEILQSTLLRAGFEQYEVSNFAQKGFESRHNMVYWQNEEFYGFGVSAHEFKAGQRKAHGRNLEQYLANPLEQEILDCNPALEELMLKLRTRQGLDLQNYQQKYQKNILKENYKFLQTAAQKGLVQFDKNFLKITPSGFLLSNEIIAKLI